MKIQGTCDFCGRNFSSPGGIYNLREAVTRRPLGWAAIFVWNMERMPEGCNFHPTKLHDFGVEVKKTCTLCMRSIKELEDNMKVINAKAKVKPVKTKNIAEDLVTPTEQSTDWVPPEEEPEDEPEDE